MMGFDGDEETVEMLHACGFTTFDGTTAEGLPMGVKLVRPKAEFTGSSSSFSLDSSLKIIFVFDGT